jgi:uroporphyrinogen decarboxylase
MNARQRHLETLLFGRPDRIPFQPGRGRESTLAAWHKQGLPEGADWFNYLLEALGVKPERIGPAVDLGVDFRLIPRFEEKVLEHREGHHVVQDWKGNICEISDRYDVTYLRSAKDFVTRRWIKCPVENRDDWEAIKTRYRLDSPGRFPTDFTERCRKAANRDWVLTAAFPGPFWQMREWCGFEGLCILMIEQPELVDEIAAFWTCFVSSMLERVLQHAVPDAAHVSEDMAYKAKAMISPSMTRRFCKPGYDCWGRQLDRAGCPIFDVDSDGFIGELIPIWMECGVNVCDPVEVAAGNDIVEYRRLFGRKMAFRGGVDKRAIAKGGQAIREELKRIEPVVRDGGYIPGCDHALPPDVSWPNFLDYCRLLAQMTGWL